MNPKSKHKPETVKPVSKEADVMRLIGDYLRVKGILNFRMNSGALKVEKRFVRFGTPGMADYLAFKRNDYNCAIDIYWLEAKTTRGAQSEAQEAFEKLVVSEGHYYKVIRSLDDLEAAFK